MKNLLIILFLLLNFTLSAQSNEEINFESYLPEDTLIQEDTIIVNYYYFPKDSTLSYDLLIMKIDSNFIKFELQRLRKIRQEKRKGW